MRLRALTFTAAAFLCLAPAASLADLSPYHQDFEGLVQADPAALSNDGWLVFGNVFDPSWNYLYGYGPFPAPNGGPAFSAIATGEGGPEQGNQQLSVYSDYNNGDHANGNLIESNVFQQQTIGAGDANKTWRLDFDAKRGNLEGASTALAFFKTLDPAAGYALTNYITVDMTTVPTTWGHYALSIFIDPGLAGQILQFGFLNVATHYEGSGIFYDNLAFDLEPLHLSLDIRPGSCPNPLNGKTQGVLPAALLGTDDFDVANVDVASLKLEGVAPIRWAYEDVATPYGGDLCGCTDAGADGYTDLTLKFDTQEIIAATGSPLRGGRFKLTLTGQTLDGVPLEAQDCVVGVGNVAPEPTAATTLQLFVPNRSGAATQRVEFTIPARSDVTLNLYDVAGRSVKQIVHSTTDVGRHAVSWDASDLSNGVYFYRLKAGGVETTARLVLQK